MLTSFVYLLVTTLFFCLICTYTWYSSLFVQYWSSFFKICLLSYIRVVSFYFSLCIYFLSTIFKVVYELNPLHVELAQLKSLLQSLMAKTDYFHHQQTRDKQRREQRIQKREKANREREIRWWSNSWHSTSACPQDSSRDQRLRNRLLLPNRCSILLPWAPCVVACCTC